ncbi:PIR Superfamily Protein [Plasmodium ovale wallikeri]|uniref:PIR Superfamily Protein n=1 Tax=Plasmodium ovale wallikeri TaxID=864142 RepID=A0A1A9AKY3_PLAOA|nr:PIR Superfamily Protein [Plasmodium ovale wallikeri]SBT57727.1 PIR Superfamily Protein [Plasmodium ovale wallikeri]
MAGRKVMDKYSFCVNSHYYEVILKLLNDKKDDVKNMKKCDSLLTSMKFSENKNATEICKEFKFLYESLCTYGKEKTRENNTLSYYDCDFLNYWLNNILRENVTKGSINVKEFYEEIKSKDNEFFFKHEDLGKYMNVIDPEILKNMKLLYELYDNAVNVINIIGDKDYKPDELENEAQENQQPKKKIQKPCSYYAEQCDKNYKEAMDRCLNSNVDYYNALKFFKGSYDFLTEKKPDELNTCKSSEFFLFLEYDPVPEKEKEKEKRIKTIKISSTLSVLSLVLPLIYKFTPLGPFLRGKINMVRNRWMNPDKNGDELLPLSTDIEDNISDYGEYNIGYYSETN